MTSRPTFKELATQTFFDRGASMGYLSAFPAEAEYLFPPLTFLKPTGRREEINAAGRHFMVLEMEPRLAS